jgi:hypothetical protein
MIAVKTAFEYNLPMRLSIDQVKSLQIGKPCVLPMKKKNSRATINILGYIDD